MFKFKPPLLAGVMTSRVRVARLFALQEPEVGSKPTIVACLKV